MGMGLCGPINAKHASILWGVLQTPEAFARKSNWLIGQGYIMARSGWVFMTCECEDSGHVSSKCVNKSCEFNPTGETDEAVRRQLGECGALL